jgi:DNA replication protein DnaC
MPADLRLASPHRCTACDDTGFVHVESGRVRHCECVKRKIAEKRMATARVPERYRHCSMENYCPQGGPARLSELAARAAVGRFIEAAKENLTGDGLLFIGPVGVGKTHLAVSVINEVQTAAPRLRCLFRDYRELLGDIRHSYNPEVGVSELTLLAPVFDADILMIDELGAERPTEWALDMVSRILNTRYNRCKATILTTNYRDLPPSDEERPDGFRRGPRPQTLGDRITEPMRSRLHEMCRVIELRGEDFRRRRRVDDAEPATVRTESSTDPTLFDATAQTGKAASGGDDGA